MPRWAFQLPIDQVGSTTVADFKLDAMRPLNERHTIVMRCPRCRHRGTLDAPDVQEVDDPTIDPEQRVSYCLRRCPNPDCHAAIFVVCRHDGEVVVSYPPEIIDFDDSGLPESVRLALDEAIRCQAAGCYRAAALLVRRTLEEVCADQGAIGPNLYTRIESLSAQVSLPNGFLEGLHDLRLLGNDAAHVELVDFDQVGQEEAEIAIEMAKLLLQPLYQYQDILGRLATRKAGS
jgi:hypothetical protein